MPGAGGRRGDLGEPEIGRTAVALGRFRRDAPIGRDQRKLALERLLRGEDDAQRRALPRRERRGQHRELGGVFACGDLSLGADVRCRDEDGETCACDRQQCLRSSKPAYWNHVIPLP